MFATFAGTDYFFVQARHQQARHLAQYYLDRMRIEGRLSASDEAEMVAQFAEAGMDVVSIEGPRESAGDPRVLRNAADPLASEVRLSVTATLRSQPLVLGRLVGAGPSGLVIRVGGRALSERVSP